ncbi:sulfotransferase [Rhizorhapis sp. SPR117]|uniref:sulfotransferase n=1 Tax=Rhizorhapis sp. SPR117 TaxID=2912611 RepID=UPI001F431653|nr:sulfotransferase domain-containing protein [Rhizorhapis sp. SPR117]
MSDDTTLPKFIIFGAVKGATTWLSYQLQHNPAVFLPDPEPHFFSSEYDRGFDWYGQFFRDAAPGQLPGEKSADYLAHPDAARRIAEAVPDIALVVQLRNPVDRAYSDYRMLYRRGTITGGPEDYLIRSTTTLPRFLDDGLYYQHLRRWFDHFPREQIKVLLYEDVRERPAWVMQEVCDHIGAPFHFAQELEHERINDGSAHLLPLPMRKLLGPLKGAVRPLRGHALFEAARRTIAQPVRYPPLSASTRAYMEEFYAGDVERLASLIGRDLRHWLPAARRAA